MDKSKIIKMLKNFKSRIFLFCHSRAGGNPELANHTLDSRLRGNDRGNASTRKSSAFQKLSAKIYQLKSILPIFRNLPPTTYHLQPKKGFAMLFSVLISSLLVAIGLSIFSLTLKELTISTSARESQVAFYAANSGMDCAIYWNFQGKFSGNTVPNGVDTQCGLFDGSSASASGNVYKFKFYITTNTDGTTNIDGPCVDVVVDKSKNVGGDLELDTVIESRGKNICGTGGRKVERGLTATIITPPPVI